MTLKTSEPMGSTLRIKFVACLALFLLSGCSFFGNSVQTCAELQEYQESVSILPLIVPDSLRNIQNKSAFNIPNTQGSNAFTQQSFTLPRAPDKSVGMAKQSNQMANIDGDELSELLRLIDQTIANRQLEEQYEPIYENLTTDYKSNPSVKPCLDGPPKYFTEEISPRSMPSQTYAQPSGVSEVGEEEKSRRQKRREARQKQRSGKQPQEEPGEDTSAKDSEEPEKPGEDKVASIWKAITGAFLGAFTGGSSEVTTLAVGQSMVPPEPTKPSDGEIIEGAAETAVEDATALADKVRNIAVLDPALNDEQRVFIQNMSDEQILEMVEVIMGQAQNQEIVKRVTTDDEIIEEAEVTIDDEKDWSERVKDQWTEGKAQREARREARQQRRAERQAQDD
ncbi:MAG TPA: hypothetical protein EYM72_02965 [Gammaproteobacteria bacterium]|nr:hypothetical protein [Gammaproteobacteria bacterium]